MERRDQHQITENPEIADPDISLSRLWRRLSRSIRANLKEGILAGILAFVPTVMFCLFSVPEYTASGSVQLEATGGLGGADALFGLSMTSGSPGVQTEIQILRRREFLLRVFRNLKLHVRDPDQPWDFSTDLDVTIGNKSPIRPELAAFREAASDVRVHEEQVKPYRLTFTGHQDGTLTAENENGEQFEVIIGDERNRIGPVTLGLKATPLDPGLSLTLDFYSDGPLYEQLSDLVSVSKVGNARDPTTIANVAVTHPDRHTAQRVTAAVLETYIQESLSWKSQSASQAATFIENQLEEVRQTLQRAEQDYRIFAESEDAIALDARVEALVANAAALEVRRMEVHARQRTYTSIESDIARSSRGKKNYNLTTNFVLDDAVLTESISSLTTSETKLEIARGTLGSQHPTILALTREVVLQRAQLSNHIKSAKRSLIASGRELEREIKDSLSKMADFPKKQLRVAQLTRELEVSQRIYTVLLERLEEAEILKASTTTDKRILDRPLLPHKKSNTPRSQIVILGMLAATFVALLATLIVHYIRRTIGTTDELLELADLPIYGILPVHQTVNAGSDVPHRLGVEEVWSQSSLNFLEAFRALSVALYLSPRGAGGQVVVVTSSQPGEGKSTVLSNLAVALTRANKRVLLVDLDLRKPVQHRIWGLTRAPGYSDLLSHSDEAERLGEHLQTIEGFQTDVLTAGTKLADPAAAIITERLTNLLQACRARYDFVLIDAAPAFVSETLALARLADQVLIVGRPLVTERPNLRHALSSIREANAHLGLIVNASRRDRAEYNSYYGGRSYAYYGEADADTDPQSSN